VKDKLAFGVIGAGGFAEIAHVPGLQSHPRAQVVALCGRRKDYAAAMAERLGIPDVYTDYGELIARDEIDAVTIVTPNVSHAEIAIAALRAGKHVFCEKPLGMNPSEVRAMLDAARASGKVHMVSFTFRYLHCLRELRKMVQRGDIGQPHYVRARGEGMSGLAPNLRVRWRDMMSLSGGGMIQDMGSHYVDCVDWIMAPIQEVCGVLLNVPRVAPHVLTGAPTPIDSDDLNAALFRTRTGILGDYMLSRITPNHGDWGFEVVGNEGALMGLLTRGDQDELQALRRGHEWEPVPLPQETEIHKPLALGRMMRAFVDAILRGGPDGEYDATFEDGYRVQVTLEAIKQSAEQKRWVEVAV
jgi:predicted dehydrogenase